MDQHRLDNGRIAATVKAAGAELVSLADARGHEFLWQAGPAWPRHAPVLFPIVGRLAADRGLYAARRIEVSGVGWLEGKNGSDWIALSRNRQDIAPLVVNSQWQPLAASPSTPRIVSC